VAGGASKVPVVLEERGDWWVPDDPGTKVPGVLRFSRDTGVALTLHGVFSLQRGSGKPHYPRLHGVVRTTPYTLENCQTVGFGVDDTQTIAIGQVLEGRLFPTAEVVTATGVSCQVTGLADWIFQPGVVLRRNREPAAGEPGIRLEGYRQPDREARTADGRTVRLEHAIQFHATMRRRHSLSDQYTWHVEPSSGETVPADQLLAWANDLRNLVAIGRARATALEEIRFTRSDWVQRLGEQEVPCPVDLPQPDFVEPDDSNAPPLFTFAHFGGIDGVSRWLDVAARHRGPLARVIATRYTPSNLQDDVLACAAALESFDRTETGHANSRFATRLRRCALLAGDTFSDLVGDVDRWIDAVRRERNDVAHHGGRPVLDSGERIDCLRESLYHLFVLCMLTSCATPAETFTALRKSHEYTRLATRLGATLLS
jgi:ApeA-like protein